MKYLARVSPRYFAAVHLFAGVNDVRYYLNGVCLQRHHEKGVVLVATNGHVLGAIHDPEGWMDPGRSEIILDAAPRRLLKACQAVAPKKRPDLEAQSLWVGECGAVVMAAGHSVTPDPFSGDALAAERIRQLAGVFPDWRRLVRDERVVAPGAQPAIAAHCLGVFDQALGILCQSDGDWSPSLRLDVSNDSSGVFVRVHQGDLEERFFGIVMPTRQSPILSTVPEWIVPTAKLAKPRVRAAEGGFVPVDRSA
ncbi:hypothetical protein [Azotobacter beijerinckii]|uniref:DNA polymerase-3 subunit beta n=1 Tax=Azotobacter beijerinckii TaxID=170623 RepID=A0A1I4GCA2_9GAMM|nr:hypothetical protein [Azotobacter beijerinckii]SFB46296.1 DNA polymerase-3 subunit beta [Azotobacter beijerinckii]SFL26746.1 DNA polymerase-3 subunit beta [Azotobacter beijerinckii]